MAEPMKTNCPNCRQSLSLPEELVGRTVSCPFCKQSFTAAASAPPDRLGAAGAPPPHRPSTGLPQVTPKMVADLASTQPWVLFLSILGFICCGLIALVGIIMMAVAAAVPRSGPFGFVACIYVPMALLYLFPAYFLLKYSGGIRGFLVTRSGPQLEQALQSQKSFWKFVGILMIVVICIYILMLVIFVVAGVGGAVMINRMH